VSPFLASDVAELEGALCAKFDPAWWFPTNEIQGAEAIEVCRQCPVRTKCLDQALRRDERWGIWGGCWPHERQALKGVAS
jgi:WhiB family redox-sensing transcriptional regulator